MYRPAPRPLMLVSPPGVAASYRRGESLSRGFSILEAEAPMPRGQRGSDGGSLQGAASHNGQCDVTAGGGGQSKNHPPAAATPRRGRFSAEKRHGPHRPPRRAAAP